MLDGPASSGVLDSEDVRDGVTSNGVSEHDGSRGIAAWEDLCGESAHACAFQGRIGDG